MSASSVARLAFDAVHLDHEIPRFGGAKGHATSLTSFFSSAGGYRVELDPSMGLVHIAHLASGSAVVVPRERVRRFEPVVEKPAVA